MQVCKKLYCRVLANDFLRPAPVDVAKKLFDFHFGGDYSVLVVDQKNVIVRCKHYPFTCEEVDQQQSEIFQEIYGSHGRYEKYGTCCDFFGKCFCDEGTPANATFFSLSLTKN